MEQSQYQSIKPVVLFYAENRRNNIFSSNEKILKSIFQTLDQWDQKLSSNSGSNSIMPFFFPKKPWNLIWKERIS